MTEKAPVSVAIPCFRCDETIVRAVESVVGQALPPMEILLVEDGSDDEGKTLDALYNLQSKYVDSAIKVISLDRNSGAAAARNRGWDEATQPYIAFLDADDTWHPEKLRIQYEYMCRNPEVVISGHQCMWLRDGEIPSNTHTPLILITTVIKPVSLVFKNCFSTPTVMLRRNIPFRFSDIKRYCEDVYLWQQIAFSGRLVIRIESQLAYIHKAPYGEGGLSAQLWEMEKGELSNFVALYRAGSINWLLFIAATGFSISKYVKRLGVTWINRAAC